MADILTRIDRHNWDAESEPVRRIVETAADEIRRLRQEVVSHVVMADVVKARLRVVEMKLDRLIIHEQKRMASGSTLEGGG